ncbi:hypothetical protein [Desulfonatronovibrio magnus]|uniref:hypothetical protein n=1 Tax=Desulfonatronovibrio magnus TaxID=698827 RepID=UPI0005EB8968|nr:hypothetical protein [Desulfonatronovibrio magnus]
MGVYVELNVLPQMIAQKDWEEIYFETLYFLQNCGLKLIGLQKESKTIGEITESRIVYSRQLEHHIDQVSERCWKVCGDLDSLKIAETFCFPYLLNQKIVHEWFFRQDKRIQFSKSDRGKGIYDRLAEC